MHIKTRWYEFANRADSSVLESRFQVENEFNILAPELFF